MSNKRICAMCKSKTAAGSVGWYCYDCAPIHYSLVAKAASAVKKAILKGILPKITHETKCVDCGKKARDYEHRDYSKPLLVEPVCRSCNIKRGPATVQVPA